MAARFAVEGQEMVSVRDISPDGCAVLTRAVPTIGAHVVLWLGDDTTGSIPMVAEVVNLVATNVPGVVRAGLRFIEPRTESGTYASTWRTVLGRALKHGITQGIPDIEMIRPMPKRTPQ